MLGIRRKNIAVEFITFLMLCLWCGLVICLYISPSQAAQMQDHMQEKYYIVDAYRKLVHRIQNRRVTKNILNREAGINSMAAWNEQIYFCSTNEGTIYKQDTEGPFHRHWTYIRDVAFDRDGNLYFSEANGARGDGEIYRIEQRQLSDPEFKPSPAHTVLLKTVDGFWEGDFTFDRQGNLYLSSGNRTPAFIYRVPREEDGYGFPERIYSDAEGAIKGIAMDPGNQSFIYYTNGSNLVYKLNLQYLGRSIAFAIPPPGPVKLSDVAFDMSPEER